MSANKGLIPRVRAKALENDRYSGCAQAVLGALQGELEIGDVQSFKAATALSGGVARRGETCGALIGALMGLGLVLGREEMSDTPAYGRTMDASQDLVERFKAALQAQFGFKHALSSTLCRDIQQRIYGRAFDLADEGERQAFLAAGGHTEFGCLKTCAIAAEVAAQKLLELTES
jgi:C_GCAxxG_C_C family probable redox protein